MSILLGLFAFAGVMALLSTVVAATVEGWHKAAASRRTGLKRVLAALHDGDMAALLGPGASAPGRRGNPSASARQFAEQMTRITPPPGAPGHAALKAFAGFRFERMSTLQFVEQLARTDAGLALRGLERAELGKALAAAAYSFERYGEIQKLAFASWSKILSVAAAIVVAFSFNVDAFTLLGRLARDQALASAVESAVRQAETVGEVDRETITKIGLPIGTRMYPYCAPAGDLEPDGRCAGLTGETALERGVQVATQPAGWLWFVSVLVTAALLGLGAPFWFDAFRWLARFVSPVRTRGPATQGAPAESAVRPIDQGFRKEEAASVDDLVRGFQIASGLEPATSPEAGDPPRGRKLA